MPTDRYRLYHVEKAKGGIGLTMTAGSAVVAEDSPPAFGNLHAYKDEIVPWIRRLTDEVHEHGAACMIQITHLGRRTGWGQDDWLPIVSASAAPRAGPPQHPQGRRGLGHRADRRQVRRRRRTDAGRVGWTASRSRRTGTCSTSSCRRSPTSATTSGVATTNGLLHFPTAVLAADPRARRARVHRRHPPGDRRDRAGGIDTPRGLAVVQRFESDGLIDFVNVIRGHIEHEAALTEVIPIHGMASVPHLDFAGMVRASTPVSR